MGFLIFNGYFFFQNEFNVVYQDIEYLIRGGKKYKPIKDF